MANKTRYVQTRTTSDTKDQSETNRNQDNNTTNGEIFEQHWFYGGIQPLCFPFFHLLDVLEMLDCSVPRTSLWKRKTRCPNFLGRRSGPKHMSTDMPVPGRAATLSWNGNPLGIMPHQCNWGMKWWGVSLIPTASSCLSAAVSLSVRFLSHLSSRGIRPTPDSWQAHSWSKQASWRPDGLPLTRAQASKRETLRLPDAADCLFGVFSLENRELSKPKPGPTSSGTEFVTEMLLSILREVTLQYSVSGPYTLPNCSAHRTSLAPRNCMLQRSCEAAPRLLDWQSCRTDPSEVMPALVVGINFV